MNRQVLSVSQANEHIRALIDNDALLSGIAVSGEISNYKVYPSGHHYFTLKDNNSALRCVMFRSNAIHLRFKPENGMKIIAVGKISVYPRDGAYQLYCTTMALDGVGDLHAAFELLKAKLASKGLFDPSHKKPIPKFPETIGIITSSAGAAIHDMLRIINKRYPLTKVLLLPVRVQGAEAPAEIVNAIQYANKYRLAEVLIVGRGGGSIEDLWAFNDERVAYAIYDSCIPIISAVGHEPDVTISDYVADLRAATPSNAAELVVPDQDSLSQTLDSFIATITTTIQRRLKNEQRHLKILSSSPTLQSPDVYIKNKQNALIQLNQRMISAQNINLNLCKQRFISHAAKLDTLSPLKVLTRGYAIVESDTKQIIRSVSQVEKGELLKVRLCDGVVSAITDEIKENA